MTRRPEFNLASGPAAMSPEALGAIILPPAYTYDPVFLETYRALETDMRRLYGTAGDVVILPAEAIAGLEAAVRGLGAPGRKGLALSSGGYGTWLGHMLAGTGTDVTEVGVAPDGALRPAIVEAAVDEHGPFDVILMVHGEGACVNPLEEIAAIARSSGAILVVDAVSTVGGMPLEVDRWGVDIVVASPHKCLSGPMPLALMAVSDRAWDMIESNRGAPRNSFLSLLDYRHKWIHGGKFPSSPPVTDVVATAAALRAVLEEGLDEVYARHARASRAAWAGVIGLGLTPWAASRDIASPSVTAARMPDGVSAGKLAAHIRANYGVFLVDSGDTVRIGHMGETARGMYPVIGVAALGRGLLDFGQEIDLGRGLEAALEVLSAGTV
ncbi:MAG: aminotransferase class V-fold PLP-dependent enzyme [Acidimicrobiia bacterium]